MTDDKPEIPPAAHLAAALAVGTDSTRAETFLDEQTRLTRLQIAQLEEDNATRRRLLRIEHASALFKLTLEIAAAVIAAVLVIGLGLAMWSAARDKGLVVQSFSVPPDLATRGLTGEVVAERLLDKLATLQNATVSNRAGSSYANNWGDDIKLQIPETGVSIGEFNRTLHAWLGHQTRITGEVWRTPTGLAVTARAGNDTSPTFTGGDADLDALLQNAAELVYRATQPYRYGVYLANVNRTAEAEAVYQDLIAHGSPTDRAWAMIGLENTYANRAEYDRSIDLLDRALAIKPHFVMSWINRAGLEGQFQHDEGAYVAMRTAMAIGQGPRDTDMSESAWTMGNLSGLSSLAADLGDYKTQIAYNRELEAMPEFSGQVENARQNDVSGYALLHDAVSSRREYENLPASTLPLVLVPRAASHAFAESALGNPDPTLSLRGTFEAFLGKLGPLGLVIEQRQFWPFVGYGFALRGDFVSAHKWIDRTPADCVQCLILRGRIDALQKNWAGAAYWMARAAHETPSTPLPLSEWGHVLLDQGDTAAAIPKFEAAHRLGPHFADPLEMWGEALLRQNHADLALAKFEEASQYAPNWPRLHLEWGKALLYAGRRDDARKQLAVASGLELTPSEKAELAALQRAP